MGGQTLQFPQTPALGFTPAQGYAAALQPSPVRISASAAAQAAGLQYPQTPAVPAIPPAKTPAASALGSMFMAGASQVVGSAAQMLSAAGSFAVGAVMQPDTLPEIALLAAAGVAAGAGGYYAYKKWWASEPAQQLQAYRQKCPEGSLMYKYLSQAPECTLEKTIVSICGASRIYGRANQYLYCDDKRIGGDVDFTDQFADLLAAMQAAEVSEADALAAKAALDKIVTEESQAKAAVGQQAIKEIQADAQAVNQVAADLVKQGSALVASTQKLEQQQAASTDPATRAGLQVQINENTQAGTQLVNKALAQASVKTEDMKSTARDTSNKVAKIEKDAENKLAHVSKKVPLVSRRKSKGTVSLYHKGKKTTVHVRKTKAKAKVVRRRPAVAKRAVVKRRPAAKRAAKRATRRR